MRNEMFITKTYNGDLMEFILGYLAVFIIFFPIGCYFLYKVTRDINEY